MVPWLFPAIGAGLQLIGGIANQEGARQANETNRDIARESNIFNASESQKNREFQASQANAQMAFQERMASTSHQREVADLRKAGLNPLLGAGMGGSPAPGGASGGGAQASANTATVGNEKAGWSSLPAVLSNAMDVQKGLSELEGQKLGRKLTAAQIENVAADTQKKGQESKVMKGGTAASWLGTTAVDRGTDYLQKLYQRYLEGGSWDAYMNAKGRQREFEESKARRELQNQTRQKRSLMW